MRRLVVDDEDAVPRRHAPRRESTPYPGPYRRAPSAFDPSATWARDGPRAQPVRRGDEASTRALPAPTPQFRRRAWRTFQRALDPLARPRPLPTRAAALSRASVFSRPSSSMLSNSPGETFEPGDRDADRLERLPRLQPEPLEHAAQRRLDRLRRRTARRPRARSRAPRARRSAVEPSPGRRRRRRRGSRRSPGNSPSRAIFSCTSGAACAHELRVPVVALLAEPERRARARTRPAAARAGRRRSSSRASRSRTCAGLEPTRSSEKRSTSSSRRHDRRLVVVAPSRAARGSSSAPSGR